MNHGRCRLLNNKCYTEKGLCRTRCLHTASQPSSLQGRGNDGGWQEKKQQRRRRNRWNVNSVRIIDDHIIYLFILQPAGSRKDQPQLAREKSTDLAKSAMFKHFDARSKVQPLQCQTLFPLNDWPRLCRPRQRRDRAKRMHAAR